MTATVCIDSCSSSYPIRGHLVHLDAAWRALIEHREYPGAIRDISGRSGGGFIAARGDDQIRGGAVFAIAGRRARALVAGAMHQRSRGAGVGALPGAQRCSRHGADAPTAGTAASLECASDLIGAGNLTVTLETDDGAQRYQGIVPITGDRLADSLQVYFENSEQLPTRLWLYADGRGACGMLLQRLPAAAAVRRPRPCAAVDDAWRRVQLIADTLTPEELRTLADAEILHRLFNEDDLRLFEPSPVYFRCRCSRERVGGMLQGLGESGDALGSGGARGSRGAL